ncbi:MAG: hypothetical protein M1469_12315, partial [Bacteroidetes bacterium]|nr:hypothetical protein [Bacteroidota bacterium]
RNYRSSHPSDSRKITNCSADFCPPSLVSARNRRFQSRSVELGLIVSCMTTITQPVKFLSSIRHPNDEKPWPHHGIAIA